MKFCHEIPETLGKLEVSVSPGLGMVPGRDTRTERQTDGQTELP